MKVRIICIFTLAALAGLAAAALAEGVVPVRSLTYDDQDGYVDVRNGTNLVARYVYKNTPKPYVYPLATPSGVAITRAFPMKTDVQGEPTDHPHHRSLWIGYGDVNGVDFWTEGEKSGKIVQTSIDFNSLTPGHWNIHTTNDWIGPDGKKVLTEERRYSFTACEYGNLVATMVTLQATEAMVKLNDTKEGFFAVRVAPKIALQGGTGHIVNSEGQKDADCWGKRARWCDYTGEVDGKTVGITVFDVPYNRNYPSYWQARDYGLLAANPFGGKEFTGDDKNDGTFMIPKGTSLTLRYVALIHDGKLDPDKINAIADGIVGKGPDRTDRQRSIVKPNNVKGKASPKAGQ